MEADGVVIGLRQEAHFWRAQHARAVEREAIWKRKARQLGRQLEQTVGGQETRLAELRRQLEAVLCEQQARIAELTRQIEEKNARMAWLEQQVFGRKSEQRPDPVAQQTPTADSGPVSAEGRRGRGQQPGAKGHGRKRRPALQTEIVVHDFPEDQRRCFRCGKLFLVLPGTEDSEVLDWELRLVRRIHKRTRYRPGGDCPGRPGIITAPGPAKLIPKGLFSIGFWVQVLLEKFLFQRPLYRVRKVLALEGLHVSQGTLTGGLRRLGELLQPVYTHLLERNRSASHWQMDETHWMVFEEIDGKDNYQWWPWVAITKDTVVYLLDPSRSAEVPRNHLGPEAAGIINADRYAAYPAVGEKVFVAFCWSHVRRDFVRIQEGYKTLAQWAESWETRINELFALNHQRLAAGSDPPASQRADRLLREAVQRMAERRDGELADPTLRAAARKALESLARHWDGCILFVDHPEIPMDNNESERRLRDPVVGRKNYYGSGSAWSGMLTAMLFSLFQTLLKNHLDPKKWLSAYFRACAQAGGRPPDSLEAFLPWNLSAEQKGAWKLPEPFR